MSEKTKNFVKNQDADRKCVADLTELRNLLLMLFFILKLSLSHTEVLRTA